jgi:uncharacterized protein YlxW (UPF0749 family)
MARGKRIKTVEERISEVESLIQTKQAEIIDLQTTLDSLKEEKQKSDLLKLSQAIAESGMSIDEALDMFKK